MTVLHLPGDQPTPPAPERVPLVRLATSSRLSPALTRVVATVGHRGPARVTVAAFQSSV